MAVRQPGDQSNLVPGLELAARVLAAVWRGSSIPIAQKADGLPLSPTPR